MNAINTLKKLVSLLVHTEFDQHKFMVLNIHDYKFPEELHNVLSLKIPMFFINIGNSYSGLVIHKQNSKSNSLLNK